MIFTVNGKEAFASHGGREHHASQKALLLVHGSGMNHEIWEQQHACIANAGINVFSIDLPGHGRSQGPMLTSISGISDWLAKFLEAAKVPVATVLGHSMGALAAIQFAASHAQHCEGIVLAGVSGDMTVNPDLLQAAKEIHPQAIEWMAKWSHTRQADTDDHAAIDASWRILESEQHHALFVDLSACNEFSATDELFAGLSVPVTMITGANDKMTPAKNGEALANTLQGCRSVLIQHAGHNMMLEKPDEFNAMVLKALSMQS